MILYHLVLKVISLPALSGNCLTLLVGREVFGGVLVVTSVEVSLSIVGVVSLVSF